MLGIFVLVLREMVDAMRTATLSNLQKSQVVDRNLIGRKRKMALNTKREFEQTINYVLLQI